MTNKFFWRVGYIYDSAVKIFGDNLFDISVFLFFFCPGSLREKIFGDYFLIRRFFKRFPVGKIQKNGSEIHIKVLDLSFYAPLHGLEQGDFFDIIIPYIKETNESYGNKVMKYYETNFYRFFDGPYITSEHGLNDGDYVIDAGCNIGLFSVIAAKKVGDSGMIFAFDPISEVLLYAQRNAAENKIINISFQQTALGEKDSEISLNINLQNSFEGSSKYINRSGLSRVVSQKTIDSFFSEKKIKKLDFIKADIEGAENDMLLGGIGVIGKFLPSLSIRTYHFPEDFGIIKNTLEKRIPAYKLSSFRNSTIYGKA